MQDELSSPFFSSRTTDAVGRYYLSTQPLAALERKPFCSGLVPDTFTLPHNLERVTKGK